MEGSITATRTLEQFFQSYREDVIGQEALIPLGDGSFRRLLYADWIASGRNYRPIEERMVAEILPLVANTHTETNTTGGAMTYAYRAARERIKQHVNAGPDDVLISAGSGMTRVINKFQRMLGMKWDEEKKRQCGAEERPVVFVTHMEHHSNHTSWLETAATVEIIRPTPSGGVDFYHL